jgi:copper(I)-binding protein
VSFGLTAAAASAILLAGCAVGQQAQTAVQPAAVDGVEAISGTLQITNAGILPPENSASYTVGESAPLQLLLVNNGAKADELVQVSTPNASSVILSPGALPPADGLAAPSTPSHLALSSSPAASTPVTPTQGAETPSGATNSPTTALPNLPIEITAGSAVRVGFEPSGTSILLSKLITPPIPGQSVPITFRFASGAEIVTKLAVKLSEGEHPAPTVSVAPEHEG